MPPAAFPAGSALVGGAVRDGLLNRLGERPDLDLVVPGDAIALCRDLGRRLGGTAVVLDPVRSIARLVLKGWTIDLARQEGSSIEEDLWRRDFRLNAIALPLEAGAPLVDPTGGLLDLERRELAAVRESNLLEDPLRLMRGLRLACTLDFALEDRTWELIQKHHGLIGKVAPERVLVELQKLVAAPRGHAGLAQVLESGLLGPWSPERSPVLERLTPEQAVRCGLREEETEGALALARLAEIFNGAALAQLRSSRQWQQRCEALRRWRSLGSSPEELATALDNLKEHERLELQLQLRGDLPALALHLPPDRAQAWLLRWRDPLDPLFHPSAPLDGVSLQRELGLCPSPLLGALLSHLTLERAFGRVCGPEQALLEARRWLKRQTETGSADP